MEPRIQYAKTSDGVSIAYTVFGEGPPLVIPPILIGSHLQVEWNLPARRGVYERLGERATVVRYDPRGMGMSGQGEIDFTVEAATRDLQSVLDSLGLARFALYARPSMGDLPLSYAARHPERVTHLVLNWWFGGVPNFELIDALIEADWGVFTNVFARLLTGWDSADATPMAALIRASHSQQTFRPAYAAITSRDSLALASEVTVPTLIVHPLAGDEAYTDMRPLAAAIAGAQVVGVPGEFSVRNYSYPNPAGIALIHDFINSAPTGPGRTIAAPELDTSAFRTILFTDVVEHTQMMERLGDEAGREVLREHERITREALREHGGAEIKTVGDSFMASFSSAQRAVECAIALQRAFASADVRGERVRIRAGVNAGEPIAEDDDLFGSSVILAARAKENADEGEIVVTDVVRQLVTGKGFLFAERGSVALRGFEEPVRLHEVRWQEAD